MGLRDNSDNWNLWYARCFLKGLFPTLPKTNKPLKSYLPKRKVVSQAPFFRGYVKLRGCNIDVFSVAFCFGTFVFLLFCPLRSLRRWAALASKATWSSEAPWLSRIVVLDGRDFLSNCHANTSDVEDNYTCLVSYRHWIFGFDFNLHEIRFEEWRVAGKHMGWVICWCQNFLSIVSF